MGPVMELIGARRGQMVEMHGRSEYAHFTFSIPARGLIGLRTRLLERHAGHRDYAPSLRTYRPMEGEIPSRLNGVLVSMSAGKVFAYGLNTLQERSDLFIAPGDEVYEGMIVGENARNDDMIVNPTKEKKLTNMRAAGKDENILLRPPRELTLETALEYIEEDELVEVTPDNIRLRKIVLSENARKKIARGGDEGGGLGCGFEVGATWTRKLPRMNADKRG